MQTVTLDFDKLQRMQKEYIWLWFARIAAIVLLVGNLGLAALMAYETSIVGQEEALGGVFSALAGAGICVVLVGYKFHHMGWFSVNFLRAANRSYECIDGDSSLTKRFRNFKRARAAKAELLK